MEEVASFSAQDQHKYWNTGTPWEVYTMTNTWAFVFSFTRQKTLNPKYNEEITLPI
jgi:hypothetical protein